jgi:Fe-S cluster assembly protein SufD
MNTVMSPPTTRDPGTAASLPCLQAFEALEREGAWRRQPSWLFPIRKAGLARFAELGYPTLQDEDWRFTSVGPIADLPFRPARPAASAGITAEVLAGLPFSRLPGDRLVFVDGRFAPEWSHLAAHEHGVVVTNLAAALENRPELIEPHLARVAVSERDAFAALNEAFFTDGAFVDVPAGKTVGDPVRLVFLTTGQEPGATVSTRNLLLVGAGGRVTVIEQRASLSEAVHVTNSITELVAGDGAVVECLRFQDEGPGALSLGGCHTRLGRGVNLRLHSFALGGRLSRYSIRAGLHGEGIEAVLNGLYIVDGDRLADHHMIVDHARPHCASHEYFNGILGGRSRGVFHGRILVRPDAQKTDAKQTNKNILISDDATAITKPQLEIYADDVKCTHGATVGQLHPEQVFYLRARGIPVEIARRMLIHAFAGEIIDRVGCAPAREELDGLIWDRLERDEQIQLGAHH